MTMSLPSAPVVNSALMGPEGEVVLMLDVVSVGSGAGFNITFEQVASEWRQGVWLGTDGILQVDGARSPHIVLWQDIAPASTHVRLLEGSGDLRLYNVWDSGRGIKDHESQSATSGMVVETLERGSRRYRCNDIGYDPSFQKLVFTLSAG
ncbi:hypothetical protein [Salsipaludibacter albus]|uniref:hypothetical protein n=1 Tax=Salsipaludibacter albus TaxID=2849650 RepID=UPI001EE3EBF4|nr:hypothetical protein [Salsipaludibacter albus]MBY5162883.1 hypothetical protein [Salsipaludibacter albus]